MFTEVDWQLLTMAEGVYKGARQMIGELQQFDGSASEDQPRG